MKLDMLYELQAPKPWGKPFPYGQREAEQKAYFDAIEQVKLADSSGMGPSGLSSTISERDAPTARRLKL